MINLREWALPVYTIMMQLAAGSMLMLWLVYSVIVKRHGRTVADQMSKNLVSIIFITVLAAVVGSHYHLSRPYFSIFALRNFSHSWLSREIAFTIAFVILVGALWILQHYQIGPTSLRLGVGWAAVTMGITTVYCMSRVYLLPTQVAWNTLATPIAFFSAMLLLGGQAIAALLLMNLYLAMLNQHPNLELHRQITRRALWWAVGLASTAAVVELVTYVLQIDQLSQGGVSARASLDLLLGLYRVLFGIRLGLLIVGVGMLAGVVLWQHRRKQPLAQLLFPVYVTFLLVLVSEVLGRFLFYAIHVRTGL